MNTCVPSTRPKYRLGRKPEKNTGFLIVVFVVLLGSGMTAALAARHAVAQQHNAVPIVATAEIKAPLPAKDAAFDYAAGLSKAFRNAADTVLPSVVTIQRTLVVKPQAELVPPNRSGGSGSSDEPFGDFLNDPFLKRFFGDNVPHLPGVPFPDIPQGKEQSMGSGVIIDSGGVILTNNHVIDGGGNIMVRLHDGREYEATDVRTDPRTDLAVVRINASGLPAARLGDSDALEVGDWVIAVGQPFGLEDSVTAGIISAKGRGIGMTAREEFLQTDAAINPGNSGGPLVNLRGEMVGVNTAISTRTGAYEGVGFAIPVNLAKWVSKELIERGSVTRAYLGVGIQQITPELASQFGLKDATGTVVTEVRPGSPAADAGVKTGDVLVEFNGHAIHSPRELQALVEQEPIGSKQSLALVRDGQQMPLTVTLRQQPADYGLARSEQSQQGTSRGEAFERLGIQVTPLTPDVAEHLGLNANEGVVITSVRSGSPADFAGLSPSMVIERVGSKPVNNLDDFRAAIKDESLGKGIMLLVRTQTASRFIVIKVAE